MLKYLPSETQTTLLSLYNVIRCSGKILYHWKEAIVISIFKQGNYPSIASNYTHTAASKLLEKMINLRLVYFLESNEFLDPSQW